MGMMGRKTKRCPRCKNICLLSQVKCEECGILFARIDKATNFAGKKRLRMGEKEQVVFVGKCPEDIKKWKLIVITVFAGLFGAHYFYVGKWIKGVLMLLMFLLTLLLGVIFNAYILATLGEIFYSYFGPVVGIYTIIWLNDIRRVCFNTFKIPVSIMTEEERENFLTKKEKKLKRKVFFANRKKQKQEEKEEEISRKERIRQADLAQKYNQKNQEIQEIKVETIEEIEILPRENEGEKK